MQVRLFKRIAFNRIAFNKSYRKYAREKESYTNLTTQYFQKS